MTNTTLRERFGIDTKNSATASRQIKEALGAKVTNTLQKAEAAKKDAEIQALQAKLAASNVARQLAVTEAVNEPDDGGQVCGVAGAGYRLRRIFTNTHHFLSRIVQNTPHAHHRKTHIRQLHLAALRVAAADV